MKKESIFTKEGVFGCDVFNLRFWKLRRSTLLRKVVSAAVEIRRFLRRGFIFQRQEKAGGFFTAVRKNKSIFFSLSSKADGRFQNGREKHHYEFFFQMCRSCSPSSLIRHSQSSRWFLSCPSWRRYCRGLRRLHELFLLPGKDQGTVTVTKF